MLNWLKEKSKNIDIRYKIVIISCLIWGIVAHGYMWFNKISINDDIHNLFGVGATYESGRWFLGIMATVYSKFMWGNYSLPVWSGIISIVILSGIAYLIIYMFNIKKKYNIILLCGIITTLPVITGLFGYLNTAPYYLLGSFLGILGCFFMKKFAKIWSFALSAVLFTFSIATYQANISVILSILLLLIIVETVDSNKKPSFIFKNAITKLICIAFSLLLHIFVSNLFINLMDINVNNRGLIGLQKNIFSRIIKTYDFFFVPSHTWYTQFPLKINILFYLLLIMLFINVILIVCYMFKNGKKNKIVILGVLLLLLPFSINVLLLVSNEMNLHTLTGYGYISLFILCIWINEFILDNINKRIKEYCIALTCVIIFAMNIMYTRYANICYLDAQLIQEEMISWNTTLITRIESIDNYSDELPVVYINRDDFNDNNIVHMEQLDVVRTVPYCYFCFQNYSWKTFMARWCGWEPKEVDNVDEYERLEEVRVMPSYPDYGSIKVINGAIVVKF